MTIYQFLRTLQARRRLIVVTMGVMLVLLFLMILIVPAKYTATASVVVNSESKDPIVGALMETPLGETFVTTQASIIESPRVAQGVVERLKLTDNPQWKEAWEEDTNGRGDEKAWIADIITIGLKVSPGHESNVVEISYKSKDPASAALFANAFTQSYLESRSGQAKLQVLRCTHRRDQRPSGGCSKAPVRRAKGGRHRGDARAS
jgi:succinoglycan biosynthesis transport protein ExoP